MDCGVSSGFYSWLCHVLGFPGGSVVKNPSASAGDVGSIPGLGISARGENGNPLQYSCLRNPLDPLGYSPWGHKRVGYDSATTQQQLPNASYACDWGLVILSP